MKPPALCFDATGTLIEPTETVGAVYQRVAREYGVDLPAWRLDDAFHRILRGAPSRGVEGDSVDARSQGEVAWWFERIRETFQATDSTVHFENFPAFAQTLFEAYRAGHAWRPRPGAIAMLTELRRRNCPMAVVSNFDHRLPEILKTLDLAPFFETIVIPSRCGAAKPARAPFESAAKAMDRPLSDLIYLGDDATETLHAIASLGPRVCDIREIDSLESVPNLVSTVATLRPDRQGD